MIFRSQPANFRIITVTINDGSSYTVTSSTPNLFIGFISDVPITSLTVEVDLSISNRWPAVNDLIVAVPEPSSFAIIALGLVGGVLRRRRTA